MFIYLNLSLITFFEATAALTWVNRPEIQFSHGKLGLYLDWGGGGVLDVQVVKCNLRKILGLIHIICYHYTLWSTWF